MKTKNKKHKSSWKKVIQFFLVYTLLFLTIFLFIDYYDFFRINPYLLTVLSIILGVVFTFVHIKSGQRGRVDDIADEL